MIRLRDSAEARFWFLHGCAWLGAFLLGYLVGPRLAPFLSLVACRPLAAIAAALLPTTALRSYRPHLWIGASVLALLTPFIPARGAAFYLLCMGFLLLWDLSLDALVVRCCPEQEWVGKTAGLGLARCLGLLFGLVASALVWAAPSWGIALVLAIMALVWLAVDDAPRQGVVAETPGVGLVVDALRSWSSASFWQAASLLVTVAFLAGVQGTALFPVLVLAPNTISNVMAEPSTWAVIGVSWVLLALTIERLALPTQLLVTLPLGLAGVWLGGASPLGSTASTIVLGLVILVAYRATLKVQAGRVDPVLAAAIPLTLWSLSQLAGEQLARAWPQQVILAQMLGSLAMLAALWASYRSWASTVRIGSATEVENGRQGGVGRHGDRIFDFEAAPAARPKRRSRILSRLWYLVAVRFPVTLTIAFLGSCVLVGTWQLMSQRQAWKAKAENAWLGFQTQLFVSRLKVRVEEEMLASNRVPTDWPDFVGSSFQLKGRAMPNRDFWGTPLSFESMPKGVRITSAGPDRKFGTPDDIWRIADKPQGVR